VKELPDILRKKINFKFLNKLDETVKNLNLKEKAIFWFFVVLLILSTSVLFILINRKITIEVPRRGGQITEGVVGSPRFINPLLAISDTDRDLTSLIYSGLIKATPDGRLINDLASNFEISEDGLRYIFFIKKEAVFHDGEPVTSDDVVFTVNLAKNNILKSPRRAAWEGINVEKINDKTVAFNLNEPYSPFLENTSMGILPVHVWGDLKTEEITFSDFNFKPIGSGPYKISSLKNNSTGIPQSIKLSSFKDYALNEPFIKKIELKFYDNEEGLVKAFSRKNIDNVHSISPKIAKLL